MTLSPIPDVLATLRAGRPVIVADDEGRENEGDAIMAAQFASQEWIAWMVRHTSGFLCAPMTNEHADFLDLPLMTVNNEDSKKTAYTITVDAADRVSTGISASDRAHTLRVLADKDSVAHDLIRPGHIVPLRAAPGGLAERAGHTEAAIELMKLAGLSPVAVIGELVEDDGEMMRMPSLLELGKDNDIPVTTVADISKWLSQNKENPEFSLGIELAQELRRVDFEVETLVPTKYGSLTMRAYKDRSTADDHIAIISGTLNTHGSLVRVHSECLTGEAFGSLKCECGPQLDAALNAISIQGGVVIYLRGHEGRGIGLINKLRAYQLQETGMDTLDANIALGFPADSRDYGGASAILSDLGIKSVRLLTNNPDKVKQLKDRGIDVSERVPLVVGVGEHNEGYLKTKGTRMGHDFGFTQDAQSHSGTNGSIETTGTTGTSGTVR